MINAEEFGITATQLRTLEQLAALITPAAGQFPSAAEADPDQEVLGLALSHFRRSLPQIRRYLSGLEPGDDLPDLATLEARDPDGFRLVCDFLVARYLTCRRVWGLLGYPGRVQAPPAPDEAESYLRGDILKPVTLRGPIYTVPPS